MRPPSLGIRFDRSMMLLVAENRGEYNASSMVIPKSRTLSATWSTPIAIRIAPGAPITNTGLLFSVMGDYKLAFTMTPTDVAAT
jgi:hypothetical protein